MLVILLLGIVQGITEFLPISSSGHLAIIQSFFPELDIPLSFDVLLHLATLLSVIAYFRRDILGLFNVFRLKTTQGKEALRLIILLFIATIPAAIIGKLFSDSIEEAFKNPIFVCIAWLIMGIVLIASRFFEHKGEEGKDLRGITFKDAILIGLASGNCNTPGYIKEWKHYSIRLGVQA